MLVLNVLSGDRQAAQLILLALALPLLGAAAVFAISHYGKTAPGNTWRSWRDGVIWAAEAGALACVAALWPFLGSEFAIPDVCGLGLSFGVDGLRYLLALLAGFLWLMTSLFSKEYLAHSGHKMRYYFFLLVTETGILGTFLSADLYTTLVFFEVMSMASWVLVAHEETAGARRAADSYLAFAVIGGLVTLMGLFLLYHQLGTLRIALLRQLGGQNLGPALYVAGGLVLFGFAAKAGMWPLHTWLPAAHPVAPAPASALLSGIITKAGMFGILVLSGQLFWQDAAWGRVILAFGVITMATGAVLAVFSIDLKRTLACSSMSQIGFILVGVGMACLLGEEGGTAVAGLVLHMANHSIFKLTLFLCAGCVVMNLHKLNLNEIRGFGRGKPALLYAFGMGALGIMGVPGWSGYISKTLLHEGIVEYAGLVAEAGGNALPYHCIEWIFLISGGLTVAYMTKLFVCLFVEKNADPEVQARYDAKNGKYMTRLSAVVLVAAGSLSPLLGLTAHLTMDKVARVAGSFFGVPVLAHPVAYFGAESLQGGLTSLAIGAAVYLLVVRPLLRDKPTGAYLNRWPAALDIEERVYRPLLCTVLPFVGAAAARLVASLAEWLRLAAQKLLHWHDNGGYVYPAQDEHFTVYEQAPKGRRGFTGSLAYSLMLFGFGLMAILVYLLLRL